MKKPEFPGRLLYYFQLGKGIYPQKPQLTFDWVVITYARAQPAPLPLLLNAELIQYFFSPKKSKMRFFITETKSSLRCS